MNNGIRNYIDGQSDRDQAICKKLAKAIARHLPEAEGKVWHAHPVWFLNDNPIVGFSRQKPGIRLMFWSGASFEEAGLNVVGRKFKDASVFYTDASAVDKAALRRGLKKARQVQWDYKNLVRRKGRLLRLRGTADTKTERKSRQRAGS
jgi:hypothetical protein